MQEEFNPKTPDRGGVRYFSYGATVSPAILSAFRRSNRIVSVQEGPNDGLVSVASSKWGEYKGTLVDVSHLDLINWTNRLRWLVWEMTGNKRKYSFPSFNLLRRVICSPKRAYDHEPSPYASAFRLVQSSYLLEAIEEKTLKGKTPARLKHIPFPVTVKATGSLRATRLPRMGACFCEDTMDTRMIGISGVGRSKTDVPRLYRIWQWDLYRNPAKILAGDSPERKFTTSAARIMAQEYKLKGLSALDLKSGEKREVEVEGIEGGKVLLARVGSTTHALSPNCTHYGAPLKLGVLTPEGRLTCAWHGACFNVGTGDVEDAPALDPLAKFEVFEQSGAVYIKGEEATIKASRRQPNVKCKAQGKEKVVVVGGGSGAMGTVQALREQGFNGDISMISKEPYLPIDRTKLSKALIADKSKVEWRSQEWFDDASIATISDEVSSIDFESKSVSTKSGKSYPYTKLILASGGTPKPLPLPGFKDLSNIFLLRTIPDVQAINGAVGEKAGKKIVVIGSSFIGMEVANALSSNNDVTVVGMESTPLERVMGKEVGKVFQKLISDKGVKFHMEASVDSAKPSKDDSSKVGSVSLKDGTSLEADLVILGIGVAPATEYLKDNSAVQLEKDGSIKTNESFEVQNQAGVYAIGDIATYPYHGPGSNGDFTRIEHWNVAQNAGRSVAASIAKPSVAPKPFIPVFWSAQGSQLRYCGNTPNGWDDLVLQGKLDDAKFVAFYGKGDTVVAVASMQMDPVMTQSAELMRRGNMLPLSELRKGKSVMDVGLPSEIKI
ncbi:MAG: hypothetical protein Q9203_007057 [Teloschistes exilis]